MSFTIAMFLLVLGSLIYAKLTYTQNIKEQKNINPRIDTQNIEDQDIG